MSKVDLEPIIVTSTVILFIIGIGCLFAGVRLCSNSDDLYFAALMVSGFILTPLFRYIMYKRYKGYFK